MQKVSTYTEIESTTQPTSTPVLSACGHCRRTFSVMQTCSRCLVKQYCGQDCQKKDWPTHKNVCVKKDPDLWTKICAKEKNWCSPESKAGPSLIEFAQENKSRCKTVKEHWDIYSKVKEYMCLNAHLLKSFDAKLPNQGEQLCIDLGTWLGEHSFYLLERNWRVIAIDFSKIATEKMAKRANAKNADWLKSNQLTIKEQNVLKYEFPENQVDLVVANDVLPYCNPSKIQSLFTKIHKALKEGGHLIGSIFPDMTGKGFLEQLAQGDLAEMGAWFIDDKAMAQNILAETGFECLRIEPRKNDPMFEFTAKKLNNRTLC